MCCLWHCIAGVVVIQWPSSPRGVVRGHVTGHVTVCLLMTYITAVMMMMMMLWRAVSRSVCRRWHMIVCMYRTCIDVAATKLRRALSGCRLHVTGYMYRNSIAVAIMKLRRTLPRRAQMRRRDVIWCMLTEDILILRLTLSRGTRRRDMIGDMRRGRITAAIIVVLRRALSKGIQISRRDVIIHLRRVRVAAIVIVLRRGLLMCMCVRRGDMMIWCRL